MSVIRRELTAGDVGDLAERLRAERRALLAGLDSVNEDLHAIEVAREMELEERSQEEAATEMLTRLGERDFAGLREIEGALHRVEVGAYGSCTACSMPIAVERLHARPSVALCSACAGKREQATEQARAGSSVDGEPEHPAEVPAELRMLDDVELATLVQETLREEVGEALDHVRVACRHGRVILGGEVASDELRQVAKRIIEDEIGLEVSDRMRVGTLAAETRRRHPRRSGEPLPALLGSGEKNIDVFEAEEEGLDYTPPSKPVAETG